ncbi:MAG: trypsin-like peptidase domain-containing protein [Actinobacteria bacterium]|nr:trypsin-like peptidase domain-containing protein [Actinomycetota bacterium]
MTDIDHVGIDQADGWSRPAGVEGSFEPNDAPPAYTPPPPTVSPEDRASFGRPAGAGEFDPPPGERMPARHGVSQPPLPPEAEAAYGRTAGGGDGFDAAPGTRIRPAGRRAQSPWWKLDAQRDPWRDPGSPAWLGRPAVLAGGELEQLAPEDDEELDENAETAAEHEPEAKLASVRVGRFGLSTLLLVLVVALVAGAIGGGAGFWLARRGSGLTNPDSKLIKVGTAANRPPGSVSDIAKRVSPAVVSIDITTASEQGTGSGVVIDGAGYILTNNHVVSPVATQSGSMLVTFSDSSTAPAKIVGRDTLTDLAVIKVDKSGLSVASLGDSAKLAVGDPVIAIGSPLGLRGTVTAGIVSALNRPVHLSGEQSDTNAVIDAIQTDAAINPGNSGGALVDAQGAVIGINSAIAALPSSSGDQNGNIGLGFAIPVNSARTIAEELIHNGKAVHASIGLSTRAVTDGTRQGAYVVQATPGGPGANAGIKAGDVITVADSNLVTSGDELTVVVQAHKPGDTIKLRYYRGGQAIDVNVTLGSV